MLRVSFAKAREEPARRFFLNQEGRKDVVPRLLGAALVMSLGLLPRAAACPKPANVKVTLVVILASEKGSTIDKRLRDLAAEIQKIQPNLKSFELKKTIERSVIPGDKQEFNLIEGKQAVVVIKHGADASNKVGLTVTPPDGGPIVYSTVCGKFLPIVTRTETKSGKRLILAICVQPCRE